MGTNLVPIGDRLEMLLDHLTVTRGLIEGYFGDSLGTTWGILQGYFRTALGLPGTTLDNLGATWVLPGDYFWTN